MRYLSNEDRKGLFLVFAGAALCAGLVWGGLKFPAAISNAIPTETPLDKHAEQPPTLHPFGEALKLVLAALMGSLVTAVHKRYHRDRPMSRSMEHAQILLCVAGAMMMIIIGNSLARAFGIAGVTGIIRFKTPVEDPKDVIILFLLIGLGMSVGLGAIAVGGLGTAFLCVFLFLLNRVGEKKPRSFVLALAADGSEFPTTHVQSLFAAYGVTFEPREVSRSAVKYFVTISPEVPLEYLSDQLLSGGYSGIKSVTWESPKKSA
jgi:hypothetical protein